MQARGRQSRDIRSVYWIYRTRIYAWRNQPVQAKLARPLPNQIKEVYSAFGFRDPMQNEPYGADLQLVFQVNPKHPHPDNYFNDVGFQLYSAYLVDLLQGFDVRAEAFPVMTIDKSGNELRNLTYFVYHPLEGVLPAMDEEKSGWTGDRDEGIQSLILDYSKFEPRPLFYCNHIYVPLMRDDLKRAIEQSGITGFDFFRPESYHTGQNRSLLNFSV
jgi:hypothetical protein